MDSIINSKKENYTDRNTMILMVCLGVQLFLSFSSSGLESYYGGNAATYRKIIYGIIAVMTLLSLGILKKTTNAFTLSTFIYLAIFWCALSSIWSDSALYSLSKTAITAVAIWITYSAVLRIGLDKSIRVVKIVLILFLIANYTSVLIIPKISTNTQNYGWSSWQWYGVMGDKNSAGALSALTFITFIFSVNKKNVVYVSLLCIFSAIFLFFSVSHTALAAGVVSAGIGIGAKVLRLTADNRVVEHRGLPKKGVIISGVIILFGFLMIAWNVGELNIFLSDPSGFSGRNQIWRPLLQSFSDHPWFGTGFGSYWSTSVRTIGSSRDSSWLDGVSQGHNGYLDLLVQVGAVGATLAVIAFIAEPAMSLKISKKTVASEIALVVSIFTFCVISNFTESGILNRDNIWQIFLVASVAMIRVLGDLPRQSERKRSRREKVGQFVN